MEFSKQEYWSGLPCPPPGNLPNPGFKTVSPMTPALQEDSLPLSHLGSPQVTLVAVLNSLTWVGKPVKASEIKWNVQRELLQSTASSESRSVVSDSLQLHGLYSSWNSLGQNTGMGSRSLLQGILQTQESNSGLLHCRWILYQLRHKGMPSCGGLDNKTSAYSAGDLGSIPAPGRSPGEGKGNPLQYSCLENPMDGGA